MNSVWPGRRRATSTGCGSLTLITSSAPANTASASATIVAPCAVKSESVIAEPVPAPAWTSTVWPRAVSSRTPAGVRPTRCSSSLISVGTPTTVMGEWSQSADRLARLDRRCAVVSVVSDEIDDHIIQLLIRNGRAPFAQIASEVGLSAHAVAERVRRLEARGAIQGYTARVDQTQLGRGLAAYIDVRLPPTTEPDHFERVVLALPATESVVVRHGPLRLHRAARVQGRRGPRPDGPGAPRARRRGRHGDPDRHALTLARVISPRGRTAGRDRRELRVRRGQGERERPAVVAGAQRLVRVDQLPERDADALVARRGAPGGLRELDAQRLRERERAVGQATGIGERERRVARAARDGRRGRWPCSPASTPGVKAPNVAGAPSVSDSVAGTVPPTVPGVSVEVGASIVASSSAIDGLRRAQDGVARGGVAIRGPGSATSSRKKIAVYLSPAVPYFSASARLRLQPATALVDPRAVLVDQVADVRVPRRIAREVGRDVALRGVGERDGDDLVDVGLHGRVERRRAGRRVSGTELPSSEAEAADRCWSRC